MTEQGLGPIAQPVLFSQGNYYADTGATFYMTKPVALAESYPFITGYDNYANTPNKRAVTDYTDISGVVYSPGCALSNLGPISTFTDNKAGAGTLRREFGIMEWGEWRVYAKATNYAGADVAIKEGSWVAPSPDGVQPYITGTQSKYGKVKEYLAAGESGFVRIFVDPERVI